MNALTLIQTEQALKHTFFLSNTDETTRLASAFAAHLSTGSVILLNGVVGAGKTHFARQLILARLNTPEDVPSPTFTLVQTYDTDVGEIWHADLYRLSDPSEVYELGLEAAFETSICLIEWSDRLGEATPTDALNLTLEIDADDKRVAHLEWDAQKWNGVITNVQRSFDHGAT